jgi:hypothetical protein
MHTFKLIIKPIIDNIDKTTLHMIHVLFWS